MPVDKEKKHKLYLLIPALWASLFDIVATIIHQPAEYWDGDLDKANEANPIGGLLMEIHVSGIFLISGLWMILIALLGYYLPRKLSKIFLLFVVIAHSMAASSWISDYGFWWPMALIALNTILYVVIDEIKTSPIK